MISPSTKRAAAVAVAVLVVGGGLVACKASPGCPLAALIGSRPADPVAREPAPGGQLPPNIEPKVNTNLLGENPMSTAASHNQVTGRVEHADAGSFEQKVLNSPVPVLVDFYADWCGPCQRLAPTLEALAKENPGAKVVKVDVDRSPELAMRYGISAIPSLRVFNRGEVVAQHVGLASKGQLLSLLGQ